MYLKQISAFVENRPGRLAEITEILADNGIDLRALSIADTTDFGILRVIVDKPEEVAELLKSKRVTVTLTDVIAIKLPDKSGALSNMLRILHLSHYDGHRSNLLSTCYYNSAFFQVGEPSCCFKYFKRN